MPQTPDLPAGAFPATRLSLLQAVARGDAEDRQQAFGTLVAVYWKAVYKYLRLRWHASAEDAQDLTQEFFVRAFEKDFLARFDPERARFRTYLRTCLDGFASNERKAARRLKRGGGAQLLSLDFEGAEGELRQHDVADPADPDACFHREWVRTLFALAVDELRARLEKAGKGVHFQIFERYDLADPAEGPRPTYAELAETHGLPTTQVTNFLALARRELRRVVLEQLRATTGSEEEFRAEARELLGAELP